MRAIPNQHVSPILGGQGHAIQRRKQHASQQLQSIPQNIPLEPCLAVDPSDDPLVKGSSSGCLLNPMCRVEGLRALGRGVKRLEAYAGLSLDEGFFSQRLTALGGLRYQSRPRKFRGGCLWKPGPGSGPGRPGVICLGRTPSPSWLSVPKRDSEFQGRIPK